MITEKAMDSLIAYMVRLSMIGEWDHAVFMRGGISCPWHSQSICAGELVKWSKKHLSEN
jgi:hypothetical protein